MTEERPFLPFGEWTPDRPSLGNGAIVAKNVIPRTSSYGPLKGTVEFSDGIGERVLGAMSVRSDLGQSFQFIGTETKLMRLAAGDTAFTDITRLSGGAYAPNEHWAFNLFGNYVSAWNGIDGPQLFELDVDTNFAQMPGSPPVGRYACNAREQVMIGRLADDPTAVAWCGIDDLATWGTNPSKLSDRQKLTGDGGWVMALVGKQSPHIWRERAIHVATFDGPPYGWRFDKLDTERGTMFPASVIGFGALSFGICDDNFYVFDGVTSRPISEDKWGEFFFRDLDQGYPDRVYGAIDPVNKLLVWAYPGQGSIGGQPNHAILFHWPSGRGAFAEIDLEFMAQASRTLGTGTGPTTSLDDLDSISASLDALPFSLDSRIFTASGALVLSIFTPNHKLAFLTGPNRQATIETGEHEIFKRKTMIQAAWPKVIGSDLAGMTVTHIGRDTLGDAETEGPAKTVNAIGYAQIRRTKRYTRGRLIIPDGRVWTDALGVEVEPVTGGGR